MRASKPVSATRTLAWSWASGERFSRIQLGNTATPECMSCVLEPAPHNRKGSTDPRTVLAALRAVPGVAAVHFISPPALVPGLKLSSSPAASPCSAVVSWVSMEL